MTRERIARCGCGGLTATCIGEPGRVSVCHCLDCQRRTGGAFSAQARFPVEAVTIAGETDTWEKAGESPASFHRCRVCGSIIAYSIEAMPGVLAIPLGAFAGGDIPVPTFSVWEKRAVAWLAIVGDDIVHD